MKTCKREICNSCQIFVLGMKILVKSRTAEGKYISMIVLGSDPSGTDMSVQLLYRPRQKLAPTFLLSPFLPPVSSCFLKNCKFQVCPDTCQHTGLRVVDRQVQFIFYLFNFQLTNKYKDIAWQSTWLTHKVASLFWAQIVSEFVQSLPEFLMVLYSLS